MKKYKQAGHIYKSRLYALFVNFFLFTLTSSIYGLITGGIGNLLLLPCYISFAACTTFSVYKVCSMIYNNTTHKRSSKVIKKEDALSTDKEQLIDLRDYSKDFSDQSTLNNEETLIPEVVQGVKQNDKLNVTFEDEVLPKSPDLSSNQRTNNKEQHTSHHPKSPCATQTQGTSFGATNYFANRTTNQQSNSLHQLQKDLTLSLPLEPKVSIADKSKVLPQVQPQNVISLVKSTVPIPPPMPAAINNKPKILFQSQDMNNFTIPTPPPFLSPFKSADASPNDSNTLKLPAPPSLTPTTIPKASIDDEPATTLQSQGQAVEQSSFSEQDNVKHDKEKVGQQQNSGASELQAPLPPPMPKSNLFANKPEAKLQGIKIQNEPIPSSMLGLNGRLLCEAGESLKKLGDIQTIYQSDRDKLLVSIRNPGIKLKDSKAPRESTKTFKRRFLTELKGEEEKRDLRKTLEKAITGRREGLDASDTDSDDNHSTPDSDEWEDAQVSRQPQSTNNSTTPTTTSQSESNQPDVQDNLTIPTPSPMPEANLFANKPKALSQEVKTQSEPIPSSTLELNDGLLCEARKSLKKPDGTKTTYQSDRDKSPDQVRKRRKEMGYSDSKSDSEFDSEGNDLPMLIHISNESKVSPKAQEENNNEAIKNYVKDSNYHMDSGISSDEGSLEKVSNNTEEMQKPNSLLDSSSLPNLKGIEEPQKTKQFSRSFFKFSRKKAPKHLSSC